MDCSASQDRPGCIQLINKGVVLCFELRRGEAPICKEQFYQALVDSLQAGMVPDCDKSLLESIVTLLPTSWTDVFLPVHGESELQSVSSKFLIPYTNALKQAYRDYKDSTGGNISAPMQSLMSAIATLPISTAACERGFSKMNIVCSPLRSTLTVDHMSSLLFISIVGPPVLEWNPLPYVKAWIVKGRRHAQFAACPARQTRDDSTDADKALWKLFN